MDCLDRDSTVPQGRSSYEKKRKKKSNTKALHKTLRCVLSPTRVALMHSTAFYGGKKSNTNRIAKKRVILHGQLGIGKRTFCKHWYEPTYLQSCVFSGGKSLWQKLGSLSGWEATIIQCHSATRVHVAKEQPSEPSEARSNAHDWTFFISSTHTHTVVVLRIIRYHTATFYRTPVCLVVLTGCFVFSSSKSHFSPLLPSMVKRKNLVQN